MVFCAFLCNLHLTVPSPAPALDVSIFHFTKEKTKAVFCASGAMYLIYKKAFRLCEPQLFKLLSVKRKSEELPLFSTVMSSWGKSLNHTVRRQTRTGFDCVRSHFSYSLATSQRTSVHSIWNCFERDLKEMQALFAGQGLREGSPRAVLTGWPWGSWGCGAAGSAARSGGCCCSCPAPPSRPRRAVPEQSHKHHKHCPCPC